MKMPPVLESVAFSLLCALFVTHLAMRFPLTETFSVYGHAQLAFSASRSRTSVSTSMSLFTSSRVEAFSL